MMVYVLTFFLSSAHAFWISDHRYLTTAMFTELRECDPSMGGPEGEALQSEITEANLNEDRNVLRKWGRDSHYFSPTRSLDMRRRTSMDRVRDMEFDSTSRRTWVAGVALHHVQDAAVPAHVMPISHWVDDGFESFTAGTPAFDFDCSNHGDFAEARTATAVLQKMAELTFSNISVSPWPLFWKDGTGGAFGSYGALGDTFGSAPGYQREVFRDFKLKQSRLAMDASRAILRVFGLLLNTGPTEPSKH